MPGLDLVVSRLNGRLDVYYLVGEDEKEMVLRARNQRELAFAREHWHLAFTHGTA